MINFFCRTPALTYDDVLLVPQSSDLDSRAEANPATRLGRMDLKVPIVSANMDSITGWEMAFSMDRLGGLGIMHRYADPDEVLRWIKCLKERNVKYIVPSVGVGPKDVDLASKYIMAGATGICVDVAHGHSFQCTETVTKLRQAWPVEDIIAGNVATAYAARDLITAGANIVKVGIGPGSLCTTRLQTGHGVPQLSAIDWVYEEIDCGGYGDKQVDIIADGGIRNSGDIVKALAVGASAVMVGNLLSGCYETPWFKTDKNVLVKKYRGMASAEAQLEWRSKVGNGLPEGASAGEIRLKSPAEDVVNPLVAGIRSGMSYSGARTIDELRANAEFVQVTPNAVRENGVHYDGGKS